MHATIISKTQFGILLTVLGCSTQALAANLPGPAGSIVGWGVETSSTPGVLSQIPDGDDFVDVSAAAGHAIALRQDGSLVGWGRNFEGQTNVPAGNDFIDIATGIRWSAALHTDGTITLWGSPGSGRPYPVDRNDYVRLEDSQSTAYGVTAGGLRFGFGSTFGGLLPELDTSVVQIASTVIGEVALYPDGHIDIRDLGFSTLQGGPTGDDFVDVAGGEATVMARRNNGEIVYWGANDGQVFEPDTKLMSWAVRGGLLLLNDGSIRTLGNLDAAPTGNYFFADVGGAGESYALALTPEPASLTTLIVTVLLIRRR